MTDSQGRPNRERPLLIHGEALRVDVNAPRVGGGDKYEPRTPEEARAILLPQIRSVIAETQALDQGLRATDRLYVEARLLPNYIAASEFPASLLSQIGATPVGSRADRATYETRNQEREAGARRLILAVDDTGLDNLAALIESGGRGRTEQQAFAEIRKLDEVALPSPERIILGSVEATTEATTWEAVLNPVTFFGQEPVPLDQETLEKWFTLVDQVGGVFYRDFVRRVGGLTFTPVKIAPEMRIEVARFNPLRAIRPMPGIRPLPAVGLRGVNRALPPRNFAPVASSHKVAVFDGGIGTNGRPSPFFPMPALDLTPEPPNPSYLAHGTGVTGAAMYGLVHPGDTAGSPPLPVDSFRVVPAPNVPYDLEAYWILDQIKEAVVQGEYRIVNLSLGPSLAVEDQMEPNRWTCELDQLAWENDVLFVVAAGNDGAADQSLGLHRVQVPADMANGLAVGSCDVPSPEIPWTRAEYSSMGPGRQGNRIQPVGVQFGGVPGREFPLLAADGTFLESTGTSFAAPLVTHALAELATRLRDPHPSVLRAFAVHFAERPRHYIKLQNEVGHGRLPLSFEDDLVCDPGELQVLYSDEITRGQILGYQIPVPTGNTGPLEVRITLAYASPVEPTQPTEYTRASLDLTFRPNQQLYRFTPPKGDKDKPVDLDIASDAAYSLLTNGWTQSQVPVAKSLGANGRLSENLLRGYGKWETIRSARTSLRSGEANAPQLEISYLGRRGGGLDASPPAVPFALLIGVRDTSGATDLYDRARAQFAALKPIQRALVRTRVRTDLE